MFHLHARVAELLRGILYVVLTVYEKDHRETSEKLFIAHALQRNSVDKKIKYTYFILIKISNLIIVK